MVASNHAAAELISLIVPIYNTDRYLDECLQAISRQSYSQFEVILLDDASTDESPAICQKYVEMDSRFHYYRFDTRKGQGGRRNYGIKVAKGNIIAFVDSDDVIAENMLKDMSELLYSTDASIALFRLQTVPGFKDETASTVEIIDGHEFIIRFCNDPAYGAFSCNKMFRKDIFLNSGLYPEGMFYEDIVLIPQICMNVEKIAVSNKSLYYYRQHPDSVVGSSYFHGKLDQIKAYRLLVPCVVKKYPDLSSLIHTKALQGIMSVYHVLIADVKNPDPLICKEILTAAKDARKHISFFSTPQKKKNLIFTFALCFPWIYSSLLKILYRKLSRRNKN